MLELKNHRTIKTIYGCSCFCSLFSSFYTVGSVTGSPVVAIFKGCSCQTFWDPVLTLSNPRKKLFKQNPMLLVVVHHGPKNKDTQLLSVSSPNIDRFSKSFHWYTQQEICNKDIITDITDPTTDPAECNSERIFKIDHYLAKLRTRVSCLVFWTTV